MTVYLTYTCFFELPDFTAAKSRLSDLYLAPHLYVQFPNKTTHKKNMLLGFLLGGYRKPRLVYPNPLKSAHSGFRFLRLWSYEVSSLHGLWDVWAQSLWA